MNTPPDTSAMANVIKMLILPLSLLFISLLIWIISSWIRASNIIRKRRQIDAAPTDGLDYTDIAAGLTREELKKIVLDEMESREKVEEIIDLNDYEELPLKPKVYFDPVKDLQEEARPRIQRSFVSNAPISENDTPETLTGLPTETASTAEPPTAPEADDEPPTQNIPPSPQPHPFQK